MSQPDTVTMDGNNAAFNIQGKQQAGSMLRNISSASTGMFNMMNQPPMHQQGLSMEQMQIQNNNMMNAKSFQQQSGMIVGQNAGGNLSLSLNSRDQSTNIGQVPLNESNAEQPQSVDGSASRMKSDQTPFLDGRFAGGWQSNADLPERRRIIFCILDVIRQMRPDTSKLSNK